MLELLALAPEDGWAYVREGGRIRLLRPPYTAASCPVDSEESVATAVSRHGFTVPPDHQRRFSDMAAVVGFLNSQVRRSRDACGIPLPEDAAESLLEFAPLATLREFLERVGNELIPNARWDHAEKLLLRMLKLPSFREQAELQQKAIGLLEQVIRVRPRESNQPNGFGPEIPDLPTTCPAAVRRYGQHWIDETSKTICSRGTVFSVRD